MDLRGFYGFARIIRFCTDYTVLRGFYGLRAPRVEMLFGRTGTPGSKAAGDGMTLRFLSVANIAAGAGRNPASRPLPRMMKISNKNHIPHPSFTPVREHLVKLW